MTVAERNRERGGRRPSGKKREENMEEEMKYINLLCDLYQFSSVTQSCPILCDPMDCTTPGLPVHRQLPEFTQTHVHWVSDAIQPSHPLSSPSPPAFHLSQYQGLFKWVSSSDSRWAKYWSFSFNISPSNEYSYYVIFIHTKVVFILCDLYTYKILLFIYNLSY